MRLCLQTEFRVRTGGSLRHTSEICDLMETDPQKGTGVTFVSRQGAAERVEWSQIKDDATRVASALERHGVRPGTRVAVLASTSRASVTLIGAIWASRAALVVLPLPTRVSSLEELVRQTWERILLVNAGIVVADIDFATLLQSAPVVEIPVVPLEHLTYEASKLTPCEVVARDSAEVAIIQFTSGSTDDPKMVPLSYRNVALNVAAIFEAGILAGWDVGLSWLPLFHDMGLIGFLITPMWAENELVLMSPDLFLASPQDWMRWVSDSQATVIGGPNFAYGIAARTLSTQTLDLSRVRLAFNGAEQIDVSTIEEFCAAAKKQGFDAGAMFCVYGMAESTLAATFPVPGRGMSVDSVDATLLEEHRQAVANFDTDARRARRFARLGRPVPGMELRISTPDGLALEQDNLVGEICLRGPSVTDGYLDRHDLTAEAFHDGWFRTGDLGYLTGGELVVTGRSKDLIIIGGRNIAPEEVERAAAQVPELRRGNVIAFSVPGRQGEVVVIVAEAREVSQSLPAKVSEAVRRSVGIAPRKVVLLDRGELPKTSSGKLQRAHCRQRFLQGKL
jgi:fatty-acyl-CoA synthase